MEKGHKQCWKFICGISVYLIFVLLQSLSTSEAASSMPIECKKIKLPNGTMIQTVQKLFQSSPLKPGCSAPGPVRKNKYGIPPTQKVCRLPDCLSNPCQNGRCEETLQGYQCHCSTGFHGTNCAERSSSKASTSTSVSVSTSKPQSTSDPAETAESTAPTDETTVTPSDHTVPATSPSRSDPPTTTALTAVSDAWTMTTSKSTTPKDPLTMTSDPPMTNDLAETPSDEITVPSTISITTAETTSNPTTTADLAETPSDETPVSSTISVTTAETTSNPTTTAGSMYKIFVSDADADTIFSAELRDELMFSSLSSSTSQPTFMKYDSMERKLYWTDYNNRTIYRSHVNGSGREAVTKPTVWPPFGMAIHEGSRILYIANPRAHKITSMSIAPGISLPGTETDFVNLAIKRIYRPRALAVDEQAGYLYMAVEASIIRVPLNAGNNIQEVYRNTDLLRLSGLSIDLSRQPRRIFFSDLAVNRTFYKDVSTPLSAGVSSAVELTNYLQNPYQERLSDVIYFNNTLYWVKQNDPPGVSMMTDYDQTNRSYRVQKISQFVKPQRIVIAFTGP